MKESRIKATEIYSFFVSGKSNKLHFCFRGLCSLQKTKEDIYASMQEMNL